MISKSVFWSIAVLWIIQTGAIANAQQKSASPMKQTPHYETPSYLKKGDTVAIVAPAGVLLNLDKAIDSAEKLMLSWGLHVIKGKHIYERSGHFAGTDAQRTEDFQWALDHPSVSAIWCARGGYGSGRIIDKINFEKFKNYPKWIIGYSDITVIHSKIHNVGFESIHGMMCTNFTDPLQSIEKSISSLKLALFGQLKKYSIQGSIDNKIGNAKGVLVGGNLSLLEALIGSKSAVNTEQKIIFIEDVGEYKYKIDRMLRSLKQAGLFENCNGLIVGDFSKLKPNNPEWKGSLESLILEVLAPYNFPIAFGFPAGHESKNNALILGRAIELKVTKENTTVLLK